MGSYAPSTLECDLLVTNGIIVSPSDLIYPPASDIAVKDGKILCIGALQGIFTAKKVVDAQGAYVTPGGVDTHVHLDQHINGALGDNFENGSRSAIAGGTTTIVAFAFQAKTDDSVLPVVEAYHKKAAGLTYCDYSFHLILTNPTRPIVEQELPMMVEQGITSVKLYMTYDPLKLKDREILNIMLATRALGMTTMIHAENSDMIDLIIEQLYEQKLGDPYYHSVARPKVAEDEATYRAISLAQLMDTPILLVHVSSAVAARHVRDAQTKLLPIHAETCPQYLYLLRDRLKGENFEGAKCVCSPPLRDSQADLDALWEAIANGTFTTVSSDHCPFSFHHPLGKQMGLKDGVSRFTDIPNGLPGVETRLPLIYKGAQEGRISVQKFVEVTASNPAKLYGLNTKGSLAAGYDADIVVWYPDEAVSFDLTNEMLHHTCDYTPFEGLKFGNWPRYTISRGEIVWSRDEGGVLGNKSHGQFVRRVKTGLRQPRGKFENEWIPQYKGRIPGITTGKGHPHIEGASQKVVGN
ncbi:dihydropyrimidinase [Cladophialophora carrionii CBS 160.54]|uniref:dihydropyrimidinase n=1 Tax=Cladophialophora carrionii CBS 160.54 TaxID=1279043 RepID=V9D6K5_9EURO|nr:dihydropyrimidinase [Cladophialophora carrionii CBS 160.54]ETI22544.1 dihydropyrimidinase [Cladophialophora carrionii CBS 160.54]